MSDWLSPYNDGVDQANIENSRVYRPPEPSFLGLEWADAPIVLAVLGVIVLTVWILKKPVGDQFKRNRLVVFFEWITRSRIQRASLAIFAINMMLLVLFVLVSDRVGCGYRCEIDDFFPKRQTPFFYDALFWMAVFSFCMIFTSKYVLAVYKWINVGGSSNKNTD